MQRIHFLLCLAYLWSWSQDARCLPNPALHQCFWILCFVNSMSEYHAQRRVSFKKKFEYIKESERIEIWGFTVESKQVELHSKGEP